VSCVIAISAISGGGKTTLTKALLPRLPGARALHFDDIPGRLLPMDYCEWSESGADYSLWNLSALEDGLRRLLAEKTAYILVDYPFGRAHPVIASYLDHAIWIDTSLDIALARHVLRDTPRKGMETILRSLDYYLARQRQAYLMHEATVLPTCDFVLDGTLPVEQSADLTMDKLCLR